MPTLSDTALVPGEAAGRTKVTIAVTGTTDPVYLTDDPGVIVAPRTTYTADDGTFTIADVPGNADLTPSGTAYTVTFDATPIATITMPTSGGPYSLLDVVSSAPAALVPAGAAQIPLTGTAAELASQNAVLALGRFGYATDTDVIKVGDGTTAWNDLAARQPAKPDPLIVSTTTPQSFTTVADYTGMTVGPFTVGARPWRVRARCSLATGNPAGTALLFHITDLANVVKATQWSNECAVANDPISMPPCEEIITTPGTYSRKLRGQGSAGTATVSGGSAAVNVTLVAEEL